MSNERFQEITPAIDQRLIVAVRKAAIDPTELIPRLYGDAPDASLEYADELDGDLVEIWPALSIEARIVAYLGAVRVEYYRYGDYDSRME